MDCAIFTQLQIQKLSAAEVQLLEDTLQARDHRLWDCVHFFLKTKKRLSQRLGSSAKVRALDWNMDIHDAQNGVRQSGEVNDPSLFWNDLGGEGGIELSW